MKTALIADNHPIYRQGIKRILLESNEFSVFEEASDIAELRGKLDSSSDIVILNPKISGVESLQLLQDISKNGSLPPVLIMATDRDHDYVLRAIKAGARGLFYSDCSPDQLVLAAKTVAAGLDYIPEELAQFLATLDSDDRALPPHHKLSNREFRVLVKIGSGQTPTQIANELNLSIKTVSTYRTRLLNKLGLKTNAQLVRYAITHKLA